jgi:proteasome lid subunit RPN8/RPN11
MLEKHIQANVQVIVRHKAFEAAQVHAREDTTRETGGVLLGKLLEPEKDQPVAVITAVVPALRAVRQAISVNFTPEAWADIWRSIDIHPDYHDETMWQIVGWYHTHPGFGIFLSSMDLNIHHGHFTQPGHVALVIDPHSGKHGFFGWDIKQEKVIECSPTQVSSLDDLELARWLKENDIATFSPADLPAAQVRFSVDEIS